MRHRFLFVNAKGVEVKVPSPEGLADLYRAGELSEDTLLYDVVTREWAPARTHPVCRFMLEEEEAVAPPPAAAPPPATAEPPASAAPDTADILGDLELIEDGGEDMVDSFLEAREREREEERMSGSFPEKEMELVGPAMDHLGYPLNPVPEVAEAERRAAAKEEPGREESGTPAPGQDRAGSADAEAGTRGGDREAASADREGRTGAEPRSPSPRRPAQGRAPAAGFRSAVAGSGAALLRQAALLALLVGVGGWGIADAWSAPLPPPLPEETMIPETPPRPPGPLAAAPVSLVPEDALAQMAASMESLRESMRLGEPPAVWMASPYLANAGAYPEVERYWERYRSFVERLRKEEESFYRSGLEEQLEAQGVYGSAQDIRIARVMQNFRGDAPRRAAHYADMNGLAAAALELHDFLVRKTAAIRYDPVERGLSRDPVLEVDVPDPATRGELELRVDRLLEALDAVAGPDPARRRDVTRHVLGRITTGSAAMAD